MSSQCAGLYGWITPLSFAWKADETPRYTTSATGLFCSAISCAIDWPEFLLSNGTRMPVFCWIALIWLAQSAHSGGQL